MAELPYFPRPRPVRLLADMRRRLRASELWLIVLSVGVGAAAGVLAVFQERIAHSLQMLLYGIDFEEHLSASARISPIGSQMASHGEIRALALRCSSKSMP